MEVKEGVKVVFGGDASGLLNAARLGKLGVAGLVTFSVAQMAMMDRAARKTQRQWEKSLTEISTLSEFTAREIANMRKEMGQLSVTSGQLFEKMARARYDIISAGFSSAADSAMVMEAATKGAVGGLTDVSVSAKALVTVLNAYELQAKDSARVNDLMFATVQQGVTTYGELAAELGEVASTAKAAGVPLEDLMALIATTTKGGISTSESVTAINQFLLASIKQGPEAKRIFRAFNIDLSNMADALRKISIIGDRDLEVLAKLVPSVRGLKAAIAGAADDGERFAGVLAELGGSQGAGDRAAGKMSGTLDHLNLQSEAAAERLKATWGAITAPGEEAALRAKIELLEKLANLLENIGDSDRWKAAMIASMMGSRGGIAGARIMTNTPETGIDYSNPNWANELLGGGSGGGDFYGPGTPSQTPTKRAATVLENIAFFRAMVEAGEYSLSEAPSTWERGARTTDRMPGQGGFNLGGGSMARAGSMTHADFARNAPAAYVQGAGSDPWAQASREINTINRLASATIGNISQSINTGIGQALVQAFGAGESAFARMAASILADLATILVEALVLRTILNSLGAGGLADAFGLASLFSDGGYVPGFAWGGYTGGAVDKHQAAGVVHAGEYVMTAEATARMGRHNLDQMNRGGDSYEINLGGVHVDATSREAGQAIADELEIALPKALRKIRQTGAARVASEFGGW